MNEKAFKAAFVNPKPTDEQVQALVNAARAISDNAWLEDSWSMGPLQVGNDEMVALETALFELGK